jgi:DNA-binding NarL/FixJ family response regulator
MRALVTPVQRTSLPDAAEVEPLTSREKEVLRLAARGHTNRQIAGLLNISVRTVETHRANLMEKLNLHNRIDLAHYAEEHGLL